MSGPASAPSVMMRNAVPGGMVRLEAAEARRLPPSLNPAMTLNAIASPMAEMMPASCVGESAFAV